MNERDKEAKGCLYSALFIFGISAFKPLIGLISGLDISKRMSVDPETGDIYRGINTLIGASIFLLIAFVFYGYSKIKK